MNEEYVEYQLDDGTIIFIEEVNSVDKGLHAVARKNEPSKLHKSIEPLSKLAEDIRVALKSNVSQPDEVKIEFGAKVSADLGVIVAKSQIEANFKVSLTWKKSVPTPS